MRLTGFILLFCIAVLGAQAQEAILQHPPLSRKSSAPTDTLIPGTSFTPTLYRINSTLGYVAGTNAYNDKGKAQCYEINGLSESYDLLGVMIWFGRSTPSSSAMITINVYDLLGTGTGLNGNIPAPLGSLHTEVLPVNQIDGTGPNFILFPESIPIWYDYTLGFEYHAVPSTDTIALLSSANGEGEMKEMAIEMKDDFLWYSLLDSWSNVTAGFYFDVNLALFPIIDETTVGISENSSFHQFNNPAREELLIQISPDRSMLQSVFIFGLNGQQVLERNYSLDRIPLDGIAFGSYLLYFEHEAAEDSYARILLID